MRPHKIINRLFICLSKRVLICELFNCFIIDSVVISVSVKVTMRLVLTFYLDLFYLQIFQTYFYKSLDLLFVFPK